MNDRLKNSPDAENEVHGLTSFEDDGQCVITPVISLDEETAQGVVEALSNLVQDGHRKAANSTPDVDGIVRAQHFEEGDVLMLTPPNDGFAADRYLMDFYDVGTKDLCSRMHLHTGMRYVRIMTGKCTRVRISTLTEPKILTKATGEKVVLATFVDEITDEEGRARVRFNAVVPPCTWVDMQIPRGTSHQFNAIGKNAVIDTVHPEESIELFREQVKRINMMAQTIFLEAEQESGDSCVLLSTESPVPDGLSCR
ncbi:hypothetical protein [Streptomyces sp. NBC_01104]|uniref:hypothetical protein n=1 Tax=Streptomyces sp. NBC_01104 TaxID=2903750 RepID=UPI0038673912|nr:hypothetical protein OG450_00520 [Streptomyces sp. NBC_01104]